MLYVDEIEKWIKETSFIPDNTFPHSGIIGERFLMPSRTRLLIPVNFDFNLNYDERGYFWECVGCEVIGGDRYGFKNGRFYKKRFLDP